MSTTTKQCPYCKSNNLVFLKTVRETAMPGPVSSDKNFDNKIISITPCMCNDCYMGFNEKDLDEETRATCFKFYEFIKPGSGVGNSAFIPFLNLIKNNAKTNDKLIEIGCYDGFILTNLEKNGFTDLTGYDPSCLISSTEHITIKKEYFTQDTVFETKVDGIIMGNVIEFIKDLHILLDKCYEILNTQGKIYIEVPTVAAVHALQYWRFPLNSFDILARDHGFNLTIVDVEDLKNLAKNQHVRVILEKRAKDSPYTPYYSEQRGKEIYDEAVEALSKSVIDMSCQKRLTSLVSDANQKGEEVIIYGSGNATFALLDCLDDDLVKNSKLVILDSDKSRHGSFYKTPQDTLVEVYHALSYLQDKKVYCLIMGVFSPYFREEIKENLRSINCTIENLFEV